VWSSSAFKKEVPDSEMLTMVQNLLNLLTSIVNEELPIQLSLKMAFHSTKIKFYLQVGRDTYIADPITCWYYKLLVECV